MAKPPLRHRPDNTFYIFPVFLPLAELLPWLLTLIGALAGVVHMAGKTLWQGKRRAVTLLLCIACLGVAGYLTFERMRMTPSAEEGSQSVPADELSRLETFRPVPAPFAPPATTHFTALWTTATAHQNTGKPYIAGNLLMVGTYQGTLDAYAASDGRPVWSLHKREQIFPPVAITASTGFIGEGHHTSPNATLTAFSLPDGKPLWERRFRSHIEAYPAFDANGTRLFMGGGETGIWCLAIDDGTPCWHADLGHSDIPPLFAGGKLFAAASLREKISHSALFELNPQTGAVNRSTQVEGNPMGSLLQATNGNLFLATAIGQVGVKKGTDAGWVHSFTPQGDLRWTQKLPAMPLPEGALLHDGSLLIYTLADGTLLALRAHDGSIAWQDKAGNAFTTDVTLIEDKGVPMFAAVTEEGTVTLRRAVDGSEITQFQVEPGSSYALYHTGLLYIVTPYAVRAYAGLPAAP